MKRRLFTILSALSLLLLLAAGVVLGILRGPRIRVTVTREPVFNKVHPLYMLIDSDGSIAEIHKLLSDNPKLVNSPLDYGRYPIHFAAAAKRRDVVELLLQMGADVNARVESYGDHAGSTPLHFAVNERDMAMVELLLERGADPGIKISGETSPIDLAVRREYTEIAERLRRAATKQSTSVNSSSGTSRPSH